MSTWRYLLLLARYQPRYFVMLGARIISIALIPQGIALTTRAIFDNITSEQAATVGFWGLAAILVGFSVMRSMIIFGNVVLSVRVEFTFATLLGMPGRLVMTTTLSARAMASTRSCVMNMTVLRASRQSFKS